VPSDVYKYTGEDAIDWLEQHVNYAGEDLTWNDLMFIRMERAIERQQQRLWMKTKRRLPLCRRQKRCR
jgi:hypothetical protein